MNKKQIIGIVIFIAIIVGVIVYKLIKDNSEDGILSGNLTTIYVATGGGKEDFLADEDVQRIMREKYKLNVVYDTWSNGKTVLWPLIREAVGKGNQDIANELTEELKNKETPSYNINSDGVTKYDALFTSDQRFYDYY